MKRSSLPLAVRLYNSLCKWSEPEQTTPVFSIRKVTRNHRMFPSDEAVYKVVYLAMRNIAQKWTMPIRDWKPALNRFAVEFAERFPR